MADPHPKPGAGRPKGSKNKFPRMLQEAVIGAAARHGSDGKGKDELDGFLDWAIRSHPREFLTMLAKMLPREVRIEADNDDEPRTFESVEDVLAEMHARGLPIPMEYMSVEEIEAELKLRRRKLPDDPLYLPSPNEDDEVELVN